MLAFTRKPNEGFWIEVDGIEPIHITIVNIDRNRVKIGCVADRETVRIYRDEVFVQVLQDRNRTSNDGASEPCPKHLSPPPSPLSTPASQP